MGFNNSLKFLLIHAFVSLYVLTPETAPWGGSAGDEVLHSSTLTRETEQLLPRKQSLKGGFLFTRNLLRSAPHGSYFPQFLVHLNNLWQVKTLHPADCRIKSVCCSPFCFSLPSALTDWSPNKPSLLPMELPCSVVSLSSLTHVGVPLWADVQSSEDGIWSPGTRVKCGFELPHLNV